MILFFFLNFFFNYFFLKLTTKEECDEFAHYAYLFKAKSPLIEWIPYADVAAAKRLGNTDFILKAVATAAPTLSVAYKEEIVDGASSKMALFTQLWIPENANKTLVFIETGTNIFEFLPFILI